nr:retrotransposon protein, putative, Ty1-copia subclass [Tanacetum cinerariifolium]
PKSNAPALNAIRAGKVQKGNKQKKSHSQMAAKGQNHRKRKISKLMLPSPRFPLHQKGKIPQRTLFVMSLLELVVQGLRASRKLKPGALSLYVGNGQREAVEAIGTFYLCLPSGLEIILNKFHYGSYITRGVISVSCLYEDGFVNRFVDNAIQVSRNNVVYFCAIPRDGIFEIDLSNSLTNESSVYAVSNKRAKLDLDSALLWHCRLGHISKKCIEKLQHDGLLNSSDLRAFEKYVSCMFGKMARKPYTHQVKRAKDLLGLIHKDVCGPFKIMSRQGASYFFTFTDDFSRSRESTREDHKKSLRSDHGGEYMSQEFLDHLKDHGIIAHHTPPYTPQHNGVSKRRNRTLLDMVRSMMSQTTLSKSFWDCALQTAARILNMVSTKKVEKTPYEVWHGKAPRLSYLKVWGCEALVKRDTHTKPDKLESRSIKCIFVGYPKETMGYSFYYPPENKVLVARNAEFLKNNLIDQEASGSLEDLEIFQEEDTHPFLDTSLNHEKDDLEIDEPQSDIVSTRRSTRTRHASDRMCLYIDAEEHELGDLGELANYKAALLDPEFENWLNAINVEMQSMKDNEVWVLVYLPPNGKTVGSKWLFKKKTDMDGNLRTMTEIWQMDVKTIFLNGYLNAEVYMEQPEGFVNPKYPNCVCKLKRSIYALKQASRQWNKRFDDEIKKFGYIQNRDEPCVYQKASGSNITFLILYVDDILIMGNSIPMLQSVRTYLGKCFAMKDLGEAAYILGIKIYRDRSKRLIGLCQSAYIEKILKRYCMENSKRGSIPMQEKLKLSKSQGASVPAEMKRMQNVPYALAIGSIMYVVRCTRPDVAFAQNITSRFQQNPGDIHWTTVKNILKYLRNTKDMFLVYEGDLKRELRVSCYTDAGYLTDADDLKSQTGYVFVLNGGAVDWKSAKQSIFATSSAEAEYIAAFDASKKAVWVRKFISRLTNESGITKGARHFRVKVHYLREKKLKLSKSQGASTPAEIKRMKNVPYASANSGDIHWTTVKNILKYLRNTKDMFPVYGGNHGETINTSYSTNTLPLPTGSLSIGKEALIEGITNTEELLRETISLSYVSFIVAQQIGPTYHASLSWPTANAGNPPYDKKKKPLTPCLHIAPTNLPFINQQEKDSLCQEIGPSADHIYEKRSETMRNMFVVLNPMLHGLVKLAGLTPQTIAIEPGTWMKIWVPKDIVTKEGGKIIYVPPTKPAVVLLHSFAMDGIFTWFLQILALSRDYSVYVPDLLFFGGSITDKNERSASFQAEFVAKGLEKLRVENVIVVGLSYGGMVGFKMAKLYPKLVKSLVASGTVIEMTESISLEAYKRLDITSWSDLLMPETVEGLKRMFSIGFHKIPWLPNFVYQHILDAMFTNRKERNELLVSLVVPDEDASSNNYSQMIHMLWGDDDKIFISDHARTMKQQLGENTTLDWIKDAGHLVPLEKPFVYNKRLKFVLERMTKDQ